MKQRIPTLDEFINENQTYTRNGYKYTNILADGDGFKKINGDFGIKKIYYKNL